MSLTVVPLGTTHQIQWDGSRNWILCKCVRRKAKPGNYYEDTSPIGYYSSPGDAAKAALRLRLGTTGEHLTLQSFVEQLAVAERAMVEFVNEKWGELAG